MTWYVFLRLKNWQDVSKQNVKKCNEHFLRTRVVVVVVVVVTVLVVVVVANIHCLEKKYQSNKLNVREKLNPMFRALVC